MTEDADFEHFRTERFFDEGDDPGLEEYSSRGDGEGSPPVVAYEFDRDYDRILYSSAFRKLGGVTQVVTSRELGDFHNRLTHSLKVAQTGVKAASWIKRNASVPEQESIRQFGGLHPSVVRAACLAHDLGHPPFGHIGEWTLKDIAEEPHRYITDYPTVAQPLMDSFEGNAQSFRIVTRLAFREALDEPSAPEPALNLTRATLAAISKYPWSRYSERGGKKWGAFESELPILSWALRDMSSPRSTLLYGREHVETRSIEAQIMDWADDIAYAVHDIEDFFRVGLIPLQSIKIIGNTPTATYNSFLERAYEALRESNKLPLAWQTNRDGTVATDRDGLVVHGGNELSKAQVDEVLRTYRTGELPGVFSRTLVEPYDGSKRHRRVLHEFASGLITAATRDLLVTGDGVVLPRDPATYVVLEVLKQLTPTFVIQRPALGSAQIGQRNILIELVSVLWRWVHSTSRADLEHGEPVLPRRLNDYIQVVSRLADDAPTPAYPSREMVQLRAILDYVASLTDAQAMAYHDRLCRGRTHSMLDPWLFI